LAERYYEAHRLLHQWGASGNIGVARLGSVRYLEGRYMRKLRTHLKHQRTVP